MSNEDAHDTFPVVRCVTHDRNCGKSVCGAHSLSRLVIYHLGFKHPERVCDICYDAYREASRGYPRYLERRLQAIFGAELYA